MRILTIGGYGFTESRFVAALVDAGVDRLADIRRRRGMRGSKYAFLNSTRLQHLLRSAGIGYVHLIELAPPQEMRQLQKLADQAAGASKQDRNQLSQPFIEAYEAQVLGQVDWVALSARLGSADSVAFFCVEGSPAACHRSLAARAVARRLMGVESVEHLRP